MGRNWEGRWVGTGREGGRNWEGRGLGTGREGG